MKRVDYKYEKFFELSPDLLCIAGYDGYFKKINQAVADVFGYTMEELYARPINDFVYEEDKAITARVRQELTRSKPLYNFENRYVTKQGEIVWLSWTSLPVDSDEVVFAIAKNITHKKKLEAERNELLANLARMNNDLLVFTSATSLDLRSPVNNLLALFDLMDLTRINDKETIELIEVLQYAGEKLKQTLNNYTDQISEKKQENLNTQDVNMQECLDEVLSSISSLIQTSRTIVHTDFSGGRKLKYNRGYMKSIFLNLITNSIKYKRPDCTPVISVYSKIVNGSIQLIVEDNGLGLDMQKLKDDLFGWPKKLHGNGENKGIGLYLVHNHVTSLGGKIQVDSKVNEGTKFTISFTA
ncbi:MAG: PAS domain-containing sensor histidine kinase [Chryseosolibacter sp.]